MDNEWTAIGGGERGAIGAASCASISQTQSYAVSTATQWIMPSVIAASDVAVTSGATTCNQVTGKFYVVTITSSLFTSGFVPLLWNGAGLTVSACAPMG